MSDERIRQLAYEIWHSEGRPHGQDKRHWEMAAKLVETETGKVPSKPRAPRKPKAALEQVAAPAATTAATKPRASSRSKPSL